MHGCLNGKVQTHQDQKKVRQVQRLLIIYDIQVTVYKELVLDRLNSQFLHTTVIFCGDCENVRRLHPELWRQKRWLLHYGNAPPHISFLIR
jgi:hypothetical protein